MKNWRSGVKKALTVVAGAAAGLVAGFFVTLAIFVAEARAGRYVYSLDDVTALRWEVIPTWIGVGVGIVLAWRAPRGLARGLLRGVAAAGVGAVVGWFVGPLLWAGRSAPWAGAVLVAAAGLVTAVAAAGVLAWRDDGAGEAA